MKTIKDASMVRSTDVLSPRQLVRAVKFGRLTAGAAWDGLADVAVTGTRAGRAWGALRIVALVRAGITCPHWGMSAVSGCHDCDVDAFVSRLAWGGWPFGVKRRAAEVARRLAQAGYVPLELPAYVD